MQRRANAQQVASQFAAQRELTGLQEAENSLCAGRENPTHSGLGETHILGGPVSGATSHKGFSLLSSRGRHSSIRKLDERLSLGASWAFSLQPVLQPVYRPAVSVFGSWVRNTHT